MPTSVKSLLVAFAVLLLPSSVLAQATLTGTVRDASGAVLPGVTVEATSPALIEKVRTAVTDESGQYRIVDLRPGTYRVDVHASRVHERSSARTSSCSGTQIVTIPVELQVGGVRGNDHGHRRHAGRRRAERSRREIVMDSDAIQAIPAARAAGALLNATPGLFVDNNGVALSPTMTFFNAHSSTRQFHVRGRRRAHDGQRLHRCRRAQRRRLFRTSTTRRTPTKSPSSSAAGSVKATSAAR